MRQKTILSCPMKTYKLVEHASCTRCMEEDCILPHSNFIFHDLAMLGQKELQTVVCVSVAHLECGKMGSSLAVLSECDLVPKIWHEN